MLRRVLLIALVALLLSMSPTLVRPAAAADGLPSYQLQYRGVGTPSAINDSGTVVGASVSSDKYTPLISAGGAPWSVLPVPAGTSAPFRRMSTTAM